MTDAATHYRELLARHYLWMVGVPFDSKVAEQKAILERALESAHRGPAVDLGSGPGFQSIALAQLGFAPVIAIDSSRELLEVVEQRRGPHAVETQHSDLEALRLLDLPPAATVVCMGDTLTHLTSRAAVEQLLGDVHGKLAPGGLFVLTWRDLTVELAGTDRFLLVQADENKIMTCFLEYASEEYVTVHDLVHLRRDGGWELTKGSYRKLRLAPAWIRAALTTAGFTVEHEEPAGGLLLVAARKG